MARIDKQRVSRRPDNPLGDTNTNPRLSTRITPNRTAYGATEKARQLSRALGNVDRTVQREAAKRVAKENLRERRQLDAAATKAAIEDANAHRTLEQAQKARSLFGDEDSRNAYLKTFYSLGARDEIDQMQKTVQENRNNPDFDATAYVDSHISGVVDGLEDPTALDAMAPRLLDAGEQIKHAAREDAIEDQLKQNQTQFNAFVRDQSESGTLDSREGIELVRQRASKSNIDPEIADRFIVAAVSSQAVDQADPSLLDGLLENGEDGTSLADNPEFTNDIATAKAKAEAARDQANQSAHLGLRFAAEDAADQGTLSDRRIRQMTDQGIITESQAVSLHNRNRSSQKSQARTARSTASFYDGGLGRAEGYQSRKEIQASLDQARQHDIQQAEASGGTAADGLRNHYRTMITQNGAMKDQWLENTFQVGYSQRSSQGTATDGLKQGAALYTMLNSMRGGKQVLARNMTDEQLTFYERYAQNSETLDADSALAQTTDELDSDVSSGGITNTQEFRQDIDNGVDKYSSYDPSYAPFNEESVKNPALVRQYLNDEASRLVQTRQLSGPEAARLAIENFPKRHSLVKGVWVRTGNNPLPDNVDTQIDSQIDGVMQGVRQSLGDVSDAGDDISPNDLEYRPDPNHPLQLRVLHNGTPVFVKNADGRRTRLVINLTRAQPDP